MCSIQLAVSSMQQSVSTMQQEVQSINLCVEQSQLDIRECLKNQHPSQEFHYSEDEARYKIVTLTCTDVVVVPCSLTCNPIRTLPNQVSYLKGSSMESFTLGPTPKIDFRCSATHL